MPARGKILVIRGGAIGDFILTLPVFSALRQQFPDVHLEVLGYPHIANLALAGKLVDRVRSIESRPLAEFFAKGGTLSEELSDYFATFHIIVSYLFDPDQIFQTNVGRCTKAQFIAGPHRPDENRQLHAVKFFLQPLERLAIFEADPVPQLSLPTERLPKNQIAIHPGSGSESKNWPEAKWLDLLKVLSLTTSWNFVLVGGEAEEDRLQRISAGLPTGRFERAENLPLIDLAAKLQGCAGFVGHDSGISHLAAALNLSGMILWGKTIQEIWRPPSQRVKILYHAKGLAEISVEQVATEFRKWFGGILI